MRVGILDELMGWDGYARTVGLDLGVCGACGVAGLGYLFLPGYREVLGSHSIIS